MVVRDRMLGGQWIVDVVGNSPYKFVVHADDAERSPYYAIERDRTEGSTEYRFATSNGVPLGTMKRSGGRSVWQAHYQIRLGGEPRLDVTEEKPIVKLLDFIVGMVPLVGKFSDYFLNPTYLVTRLDGAPALRLRKGRSAYDMLFTIERLSELTAAEQEIAMLSLVMVIFRERSRG